MLTFDHDKSQKLDEEIITTLSSLLQNQKLIKQKMEKQEFLLKERKVVYDLFMRVNEERRLLRDEYLILLQKLTQTEDVTVYKYLKESYNVKQKMNEELYKKFMEKEKARNQQLVELVSSQQHEIAELKEKLSMKQTKPKRDVSSEKKLVVPEKVEKEYETEKKVLKNYLEADINELLARKSENEKLEIELITNSEDAPPVNTNSERVVPVKEIRKVKKSQTPVPYEHHSKKPVPEKRKKSTDNNKSVTEQKTPKVPAKAVASQQKIRTGRNTKSPQKSARVISKPVPKEQKIIAQSLDAGQSQEYLMHLIKDMGPEKKAMAEEEKRLNDAIMESKISPEPSSDLVTYNTQEEFPETIASSAKENPVVEPPETTVNNTEPSELLLTLGKPSAKEPPVTSRVENRFIGYIAPVKFKTFEKLSRTQNVSPFNRSRALIKEVKAKPNSELVAGSRNTNNKVMGTGGTMKSSGKKPVRNVTATGSPTGRLERKLETTTKKPDLASDFTTPHFREPSMQNPKDSLKSA